MSFARIMMPLKSGGPHERCQFGVVRLCSILGLKPGMRSAKNLGREQETLARLRPSGTWSAGTTLPRRLSARCSGDGLDSDDPEVARCHTFLFTSIFPG